MNLNDLDFTDLLAVRSYLRDLDDSAINTQERSRKLAAVQLAIDRMINGI